MRVKSKVSVRLPEVPVIVTALDPVVAVGVAWKSNFCRYVPCPWMRAFTPRGRRDRLSVTAPLKPFKGVMVIKA